MQNQGDSHEAYTRAFFGKLVPKYDFVVWPLRPLRRKVAALCRSRGTNVLDLACGTGEQSIALARAGCSVTGIDITEEMLSVARSKVRPGMKLDFRLQDASHLPFAYNAFDASTISLALHDMPFTMALSTLREMRRVTKPGGFIVIVEHAPPTNLVSRFLHHIMVRTDTRYYPEFIERGIDRYLQDAGLAVDQRFVALFGIIQVICCRT